MYRVIAIIMSVLMLSLLTMPCSDDIDLHSNDITYNDVHNHDSPTDQHDNCSPFCVCNCCKSMTIYSFKKIELPEVFLAHFFEKSFSFLNGQILQKSVLDIWQPPKLS